MLLSAAGERYQSGDYAARNPQWHVEHSPWKAAHVLRMLRRHRLAPRRIAEVGCGAGEILRQLHDALDDEVELVGYDVSPDAHERSAGRATGRLRFVLGTLEPGREHYDLLLLMDVVEHVEDPFGFLRRIKPAADVKLLHLPLEMSVQSLLRRDFFRAVHDSAGHLHFFSPQTACELLREVDYEVLDLVYTAGSLDFRPTSLLMALAWLPRKLLFMLHPPLASRLLGGFSMLVLAR